MKKIIVATAFVFTVFACFTSCTKQANNPLIGVWRRIVPVDTIHLIIYDTVYIKITDNVNMEYGYATGYGYVNQASGIYTYTPSQFIFTIQVDDTGNNCVGYPATYNYIASDTGGVSQLTLAVVSDTCKGLVTKVKQRSTLFNGTFFWQ